jgi:hypothetical protein
MRSKRNYAGAHLQFYEQMSQVASTSGGRLIIILEVHVFERMTQVAITSDSASSAWKHSAYSITSSVQG